MTIKQELKKNIGKGIDVNFTGGFFASNINGIITRIIQPHFFELDYCDVGNRKQVININRIESYGILDKEETKDLKHKHRWNKEMINYKYVFILFMLGILMFIASEVIF